MSVSSAVRERILSGFMYGSQDQLKPNKEWLKFALHLSVSNGGVGFDNAVTRLLTGGEALIPSSSKATIWDLPRVTMADRALAIERLKRRFGFVGLTERFEDSCEILFGLLGKPYQRSDLRLNETPLDLEISEVPPGTLYLLEQRLAHDIAVYAAACDRYNEFASAHHFPLADPFENRPRRRARSPAGIMRIWLMLRVRSGHRPMTSGSHVRSIGRGAGSSSGITLPSRITVGR